jgi:hypothetical protein
VKNDPKKAFPVKEDRKDPILPRESRFKRFLYPETNLSNSEQ